MENINPERLEILERIKSYESRGFFDTDVENDPPAKVLEADEIDYLRKKLSNKIKSAIVNRKADKAIDSLIANKQIIIDKVIGAENIKDIKGPAFITSNHFHIFENMAIYKVFKDYAPNKHKFYRVIREGNYTAPPKGFDMFFKHANTLPLSSSRNTMKKLISALEVLTKKNNYILMYPEQYLWWNFKKPRPFKNGVYKFASKLNVPIIPCFITMEDSDIKDGDGLFVQKYTVHIGKPIYSDKKLTAKENVENMREANFNFCKDVYEDAYKVKLKYTCEK